ncbi:hypothetical protein CRV08_08615 [Halarcobacter ebronensis]|uniref:Uncharacterized protein n=1 Tax=Halarcobacter ebronensis TaxID=1462615 RepID=A0A4Q0YDY3_9BACT|nr:hypothetical protein [Halarcobacter ebronensis]RXJ68303.1 hypothetical protein CRV08_08615 [Halarcobacter ebronensis]
MGKEIKLFIKGITNSFNTDFYTQMVTPTKQYGYIIKKTNEKRKKSSEKISKETDEQITRLSAIC